MTIRHCMFSFIHKLWAPYRNGQNTWYLAATKLDTCFHNKSPGSTLHNGERYENFIMTVWWWHHCAVFSLASAAWLSCVRLRQRKALTIIIKLETKFLWEKPNVISNCVLVGITTNVCEGKVLNNNQICEREVSP